VDGSLVIRLAFSLRIRPEMPSPRKKGSFCTLYDVGVTCSSTRYGPLVLKRSLAEIPCEVSDKTCFRTMTMSPGVNNGVFLLVFFMSICR
jgi:hypothetical protein